MKDLVYTYKGNSYMVINENALMKHPVTGDWLRAVIYTDKEGVTYTRERLDFVKKFQLK